jgi:hypothetical protein
MQRRPRKLPPVLQCNWDQRNPKTTARTWPERHPQGRVRISPIGRQQHVDEMSLKEVERKRAVFVGFIRNSRRLLTIKRHAIKSQGT